MTSRCACIGIEIGSYDNQVLLRPPPGLIFRNTPDREPAVGLSIDACLAGEVAALWAAGIRTTGCCCGHNRALPFIGVVADDIAAMKALGYQVAFNASRPGDEDSFQPLSLPA